MVGRCTTDDATDVARTGVDLALACSDLWRLNGPQGEGAAVCADWEEGADEDWGEESDGPESPRVPDTRPDWFELGTFLRNLLRVITRLPLIWSVKTPAGAFVTRIFGSRVPGEPLLLRCEWPSFSLSHWLTSCSGHGEFGTDGLAGIGVFDEWGSQLGTLVEYGLSDGEVLAFAFLLPHVRAYVEDVVPQDNGLMYVPDLCSDSPLFYDLTVRAELDEVELPSLIESARGLVAHPLRRRSTSLGMASLLPPAPLAIDDAFRVRWGELPCATTSQREEILRSACPEARALGYEELLAMTSAERRASLRGARLVYVFHNAIDRAGEGRQDELCLACDRAIDELVALVALLARELRAANALVCADHGFVYTKEPLGSLDRVCAREVSGGSAFVTHRRAILAGAGASSDSLLRVRMGASGCGDLPSSLMGFTPRGYLRVAQPGAGEAFVHGGASLQELCVPILRFRNLRRGSRGYVEAHAARIALLGASRSITVPRVALDIQQLDAVAGKVCPALYEVCFEDASGERLSSSVRVRADRREVNGCAGAISVWLDLTRLPSDGSRDAFLVARVEQGGEVVRERFSLDLVAGALTPGLA